jgi:hypothetical protein
MVLVLACFPPPDAGWIKHQYIMILLYVKPMNIATIRTNSNQNLFPWLTVNFSWSTFVFMAVSVRSHGLPDQDYDYDYDYEAQASSELPCARRDGLAPLSLAPPPLLCHLLPVAKVKGKRPCVGRKK